VEINSTQITKRNTAGFAQAIDKKPVITPFICLRYNDFLAGMTSSAGSLLAGVRRRMEEWQTRLQRRDAAVAARESALRKREADADIRERHLQAETARLGAWEMDLKT